MSHRKILSIKNVAQLLGKKGINPTAHYQPSSLPPKTKPAEAGIFGVIFGVI